MNDQNEVEDETVETPPKLVVTVSGIAFNFDFVSSSPDISRADEIRVLLVKNKKPLKGSKEGKPAAFGLPTGQTEDKETVEQAIKRETRDESGYTVRSIVGKTFMVFKPWVPNEIHVFIIETNDYSVGVREKMEIDYTIEPWHTLREVFSLPSAQDKMGGNRNPDGIFYSHRQRLFRTIETMLRHPEDLIDGDKIAKWIVPNREVLLSAMVDLGNDGLLTELHEQYAYYAETEDEEEEVGS